MSYKHIKTLKGLTLDEIKDFSKSDTKHYFRVKLYDKNPMCWGCGLDIDSVDKATLDHIVPRTFGGRTRESNVQLMHMRCNSKKSSSLPKYIDPRAFVPMKKNTPREV